MWSAVLLWQRESPRELGATAISCGVGLVLVYVVRVLVNMFVK